MNNFAKIQGMPDDSILQKLLRFCSYRERSPYEVNEKLKKIGVVDEQERNQYLQYLEETGILSELRFVEQYVSGKINSKKWGPKKILYEIRKHGILPSKIQEKLESERDIFFKHACEIAKKKVKNKTTLNRNEQLKLFRYLYGKGYPEEIIKNILKKYAANESGSEE